MTRLLKIIYLCSLLPLLSGSSVFFYWFYKRTWFAQDIQIELVAFFIILGFLMLTLVTIILCIVYTIKNRTDRKKIIIPIVIIGFTIPLIDLYYTLYTSLSDKAFVRIINDTDRKIDKIWSDNYEMIYFDDKESDFVISFYPVYTYDWSTKYSLGYHYSINKIHIDLKQKGDSIVTYNLPEFSKGNCKTIKLTEIIKGKSKINR